MAFKIAVHQAIFSIPPQKHAAAKKKIDYPQRKLCYCKSFQMERVPNNQDHYYGFDHQDKKSSQKSPHPCGLTPKIKKVPQSILSSLIE